jgi:hypothetical protein
MRITEKQATLDLLDKQLAWLRGVKATGIDPKNLADSDKVRMVSALLTMDDIDKQHYGRIGVQLDLERIADRIEELIIAGSW